MAATLNAAGADGTRIKIRHGVIIADGVKAGGYVLRGGDDRWKAVYLAYDPSSRPRDLDAEED